jgi:DNA primase
MPRITKENARQLSAMGHEARRRQRSAEKERLALIDRLLAQAAEQSAVPPATPSVNLTTLMLERAHEYAEHLAQLRAQLRAERDPAKVDRLAAAILKIEEVYWVYARIPRPGSCRPKEQKPAPRRVVGPIEGPPA